MPANLSPNVERLELERETANEALEPAPRDLLYPKHTPMPRVKILRKIMLADRFFGFWMRYEASPREDGQVGRIVMTTAQKGTMMNQNIQDT